MCGIFGIVASANSGWSARSVRAGVDRLFLLSESRGKEAAGLALRASDAIHVLRQPLAASAMLRTTQYAQVFDRVLGANGAMLSDPVAVIGHSRLATNGLQGINENNQPVVADGLVGVHNGIIVNDDELWSRYPELERRYEVDTEVLLRLIRHFANETPPLDQAVSAAFAVIEGAASVAILLEDTERLILATNTGSLYLCLNEEGTACAFASEEYILTRFIEQGGLPSNFTKDGVSKIPAGTGCLVSIEDVILVPFTFSTFLEGERPREPVLEVARPGAAVPIIDCSRGGDGERREFRRCTSCVLPETMPFIQFDSKGVCNYCRNYAPSNVMGHDALEQLVAPHRSGSEKADCLVAFSGGRDSTYGLHYMKQVLGMNPIAYTYDWGMVTDLARRNAARICGKLGVEHIIVSANIKQKRGYIRKNVDAWLKRPALGMIPLFMAGDKQFYYYAHKLREQTGVSLMVFSAGNKLETTDFKTGFCGIPGGSPKGLLTSLPLASKLHLVAYYLKQYLLNPSYINASIKDTLAAFYCSYVLPDDYVYLYHYIRWDEDEIMKTLRDEYDWEAASDTRATWRIGDGTASFYNYIYFTVAGFTEHDTFRSNQVREGIMTRDEAMQHLREENRPRYESIREYAHLIGLDFDDAMYVINAIPKLYDAHDLQ